MILVAKKKTVFIVMLIIIIAALSVGAGVLVASSVSPKTSYKIVIDPGHGGVDKGVVGQGGTKESEFNLLMAKELKSFLNQAGFEVILTRENSDGLYGDTSDNFKKRDMLARKNIIINNNPDMIISIHANKYPDRNRRGAQAFFDAHNDGGKVLASNIQCGLNALNTQYVERSFSALAGDYFMLKCSHVPSVLIECGFLSNNEDEKLLNSAEYRLELAFSIYSGVVGFLETL